MSCLRVVNLIQVIIVLCPHPPLLTFLICQILCKVNINKKLVHKYKKVNILNSLAVRVEEGLESQASSIVRGRLSPGIATLENHWCLLAK